MYSEIALQIAIKFNELPIETQAITILTTLIIIEIIAFFYIRHITR